MIIKELSNLDISKLENINKNELKLNKDEYIGLIYNTPENKSFIDLTDFNKSNNKLPNKITKHWKKLINKIYVKEYKFVVWKEEYRKGFELTGEVYEEILDIFAGKIGIEYYVLLKTPENYYLKLFPEYFHEIFLLNIKVSYGKIINPIKTYINNKTKKISLDILQYKTKLLNEI